MSSSLSAFTYKKILTVDTTSAKANITGTDQTAFPVCVAINSSSWTNATERGHFFDSSNTNGKRIQFFDSSGTNLPYEVEKYDSGNQVAVYWVKKTVYGNHNDASNTITVGYSTGTSPNSTDQDQPTSVWDSSFVGVWHMPGANGNASDSTTNGLTLTDNASSTTYTGIVAGGVGFNGTSDYFSSTSATLGVTSAITLEAWANWTGDSNSYTSLIGREDASNGYTLLVKSNNKLAFYLSGGTPGSIDGTGSALATSGWSYVAAGASGTAINTYINGAVDYTGSKTSGAWGAGGTFYLGKSNSASREYNGCMDEVRISSIKRSADWIRATYYSIKSTSYNGDGWITWAAEASTGTTLAIAGLSQATTLDAPTLTQHHVLAVDGISQATTVANVVIAQHVTQTWDLTLQAAAASLGIDGLTQATTLGNVALSTRQTLAIAGLAQATTLDNVSLQNSVTKYGASTSATADANATAFQAAVDANPGGVVTVPAGTFNLAKVVITHPVTIIGAGKASTTLKAKDGLNDTLLLVYQTSNVNISALSIDGNIAHWTTGYAHGIAFSASPDCTVDSCDISHCRYTGVSAYNGSDRCVVTNCTFTGNENCVEFHSSAYGRAANCVSVDCSMESYAIFNEAGQTGAHHCTIEDCSSTNTLPDVARTSAGVDVGRSWSNIVRRNTITGTAWGIYVEQSYGDSGTDNHDNLIENNVIIAGAASTRYALDCEYGGYGNVFRGNSVTNWPTSPASDCYPLHITATDTVVQSNTFSGCQAVNVNATTCALLSNTFEAVTGTGTIVDIGNTYSGTKTLATPSDPTVLTVGGVSYSYAGGVWTTTVNRTLAINGLSQGTTLAQVGTLTSHVTQTWDLTLFSTRAIGIDGVSQGTTLDNVALAQHIPYTVDVTVEQTLATDGLTQATTLGNVALAQHRILGISSITQATTLDNVGMLSQHFALRVDGITQATTLANVSLNQFVRAIAIDGLTQGTSLSDVGLGQCHRLTIDALTVATTLGNVTVTTTGHSYLQSDDLATGSTLGNVALAQTHKLRIASLTQPTVLSMSAAMIPSRKPHHIDGSGGRAPSKGATLQGHVGAGSMTRKGTP